jgi:L-2-hydroxyglutarate oxidase LhgO
MAGVEVMVLEGERHFGSWTSSRNSEVVHAGIYYAPGSLKATLCLEGRDRLYRFCAEHALPHRRCGKLIVAASAEQTAALDGIAALALANGVEDLIWLTGAQARELEPQVACAAALLSPSTGIIDSHAYMLALLAQAEASGAQLVCATRVERIDRDGGFWRLW